MNNYFIILAAGNSSRFKSKIPKQYSMYKGIQTFHHSINKALESKMFKKVILVINKNHGKYIYKLDKKNIIVINGGKQRHISCFKALKFLKKFKPNRVFIHDAARPNFSIKLLKNLNKHLKNYNAVIPYTKPVETILSKNKKKFKILKKENIILNQTPQCFNFKSLYELSKYNKSLVTDESSLFIKNNLKIKFIKGEENNFKITKRSDLSRVNFKHYYGIGFDIHRLKKSKKLFLGGIQIPFHSGLQGHSDGDVILHAIIDGLLGAIGKKDIGSIYPSDNKKYKNIRSTNMLVPILENFYKYGNSIENIDINLICEKPKVSKYRKKIIISLANLLNLRQNQINLKGKTVEKLGLIGKEKAIACETIVSIKKYA